MMKKLLLLAIGGALSLGASAQQKVQSVPFNGNTNKFQDRTPVEERYNLVQSPDRVSGRTATPAAAKGTGVGGSRWYDHFDIVSTLNNNVFNTTANYALIPIWGDTVVRQRFASGYEMVNYTSVSQIIDPITSALYNASPKYNGQVIIRNYNAYKVDSIMMGAAYIRMPNRPSNIVDTLVITVSAQAQALGYIFGKNHPDYGTRVSAYLTAAQSTDTSIFAMVPQNVDSIQRTLKGGTTWKVLLVDTSGDAPQQNGNVTLRNFKWAVPNGGLSMAAGSRPSVSITFKSGDNYTVADSIYDFHRFMPVSGYLTTGAGGPMRYYVDAYNDYSNGGLMFNGASTTTNRYLPTLIIELINDNNFRYEYHDISMFLSCTDCDRVSVKDVDAIQVVNAHPNPASDKVAVPFTLKNTSDVKVSLVNAFGQVVATENYKGVQSATVNFNVSTLPAGVYMYTIEAAGNVKSGRVSVIH